MFSSGGILSADDHLFHFKFAELLRTNGSKVVTDFNWIYLSDMAAGNNNYPLYLHQVFTVPFTFFSDRETGLKLSDVFWAALTVAFFYLALRLSGSKRALLITLFMLTIFSVAFRIGIGRAYIFTIALVFLEMVLAAKKRYVLLFLICAFHVLFHWTSFFMPLMAVFSLEVGRYLASRQFCLKNLAAATAGIIAGIILNPSFLANIGKWTDFIIGVPIRILSNESFQKVGGTELWNKSLHEILRASETTFLIFALSIGIFFFFLVRSRENLDLAEHESLKPSDSPQKYREALFYGSFIFMILAFLGT